MNALTLFPEPTTAIVPRQVLLAQIRERLEAVKADIRTCGQDREPHVIAHDLVEILAELDSVRDTVLQTIRMLP